MKMRARAIGALALAAVVIASCDGSSDRPAPSPAPTPPNVLVIMTDDQRAAGTMGVMDASRRVLADRGTTFTQAFATTPFCCPSRASVFTGRYAHNHGVLVNVAGNQDLLDQSTTVQYHLQQAGYRTGIFGKYLNGWNLRSGPPHFDEWAIFDASETGYYDGLWNVDGRPQRVRTYSTTYIRTRAEKFIEAAQDDARPWLLFVHTSAPHRPFVPAPRYADAIVPVLRTNPAIREKDRADKPPWLRSRNLPLKFARGTYRQQLRTLMSVDDLVSRISDVLAETGEEDNTLVFFLSDNGYLWGEHKVRTKMLPYTQSIRIPLILRWPGRVAEGTQDDRLAATIDIAPTIFDATGVEPEQQALDGRSLLDDWDRKRLLVEFWAAFGRDTWAGIRSRSALYVEYYKADGETVTFRELYDLEADPWELDNLLAGRKSLPVRVDDLHDLLVRDRTCAGENCP
jgi:arylsulfatase A-like enzyme